MSRVCWASFCVHARMLELLFVDSSLVKEEQHAAVPATTTSPNTTCFSRCFSCGLSTYSLCSTEDAMMTQDGAVKKCLIEASDSLSNGCRRELGRSMYMAFFIWQPQGLLTAPCDDDIKKLCLSGSKQQGGEVTPGAVETCLSEIVSSFWQC